MTPVDTERVSFRVARDRIHSSVLKPHPQAMMDFIDPNLEIDEELSLPATTIDAIPTNLSLPCIDWFHTNIGGIDVPVFQSLNQAVRRRVLAVDTSLDLVNLLVGQNSDIARYREFIQEGF